MEAVNFGPTYIVKKSLPPTLADLGSNLLTFSVNLCPEGRKRQKFLKVIYFNIIYFSLLKETSRGIFFCFQDFILKHIFTTEFLF